MQRALLVASLTILASLPAVPGGAWGGAGQEAGVSRQPVQPSDGTCEELGVRDLHRKRLHWAPERATYTWSVLVANEGLRPANVEVIFYVVDEAQRVVDSDRQSATVPAGNRSRRHVEQPSSVVPQGPTARIERRQPRPAPEGAGDVVGMAARLSCEPA